MVHSDRASECRNPVRYLSRSGQHGVRAILGRLGADSKIEVEDEFFAEPFRYSIDIELVQAFIALRTKESLAPVDKG